MKIRLFILFFIVMFIVSCVETPVSDLPYKHIYYELSDNVWYMECKNTEFAKHYQIFLEKNPEVAKKVISVFSDGDGSSGTDCGYFVILK